MIDFQKLSEPFPVEQVSWRIMGAIVNGTAPVAAFIDSRDVMHRLDSVCEPANWKSSYWYHDTTAICQLSLRIEGEWLTKEDGAGGGDLEFEKAQISNALKRAAVCWGIGRYLYSIKDPVTGNLPWVSVDNQGKIPDDQLAYLYSLLPNYDKDRNLKLVSLQGQAKTESPFWQQKSYNILTKLPNKQKDQHGDPVWQDPETISWLYATMPTFITRSPSRLALTKLQVDNMAWLQVQFDEASLKAILEMFAVRAAQFDQLGETK